MNSTLTIAQREVIEKRFVFVAAAAFLVVALAIPFVPGVHPGERAAALVVGSMGLSSIFTLGLAAILGASIVGRDLSDGRLSFYFSKPLPATSIWWGKLVAALVLVGACYFIIGFPALIAGVTAPRDAVQILAWVPAIAAALFLVSHVIGTFVRSRSAWFLFDFLALTLFAAALWILTLWLMNGYAFELLKRLGEIAGIFMCLTMIAAGAWQIARGRTDRRRSHKELSRFLWATLGCGVLIVAAYVAWVVSATPRDVPKPDYANQSSGSWAFFGGRARNRMDYRAMFLYDLDGGRYLRLPKMQPWWPAAFSNDGKVAVWVIPSKDGDEVHFAQLDESKPRDIETPFRLTKWHAFNVSPDGSRIVTIDKDGILTVDDLRSGKSAGSARVPNAGPSNAVFINSNLVRIYVFGQSIYEYDVARRVLTPTGSLPKGYPRFNVDRSRMTIVTREGIEVRDARSGELLQTMPGVFEMVRFLRDGRIAAIPQGRQSLTIFSGGNAVSVPVASDYIYEVPGGPLVTTSRAGCTVIDSSKGTVLGTEPGIHPLSYYNTTARLLASWNDTIVVWDPATGDKRPIS